MSINIGCGILIPGEGDIVRGNDPSRSDYGKRGRIIKTVNGRVFTYDCEYIHTVLWENGDTVTLNDKQVCFDHPNSLRVKP